MDLCSNRKTRSRMTTVDELCVRPEVPTAMRRTLDDAEALSVVGGAVPVPAAEFARRAFRYTLDPLANPVKEVMDAFPSVRAMPPMLGIFNDIPAHQMRDDEVQSWARAETMASTGRRGRSFLKTSSALLSPSLTPALCACCSTHAGRRARQMRCCFATACSPCSGCTERRSRSTAMPSSWGRELR